MRLQDYYRLGKSVIKSRLHQEGIGFSMPYKYNIQVTNVCQSQCKTCNIWKIYEDNPELMDKEMDLDELKKTVDNVSEHIQWLGIHGGEPFLYPDIVEFAKYCFDNCPNLFLVNIPTNGIANENISSKLEEILEAKPDHIQLTVTISLDGIEEQHDKIRGVPGNWERLMELYEDLERFEEEYKNFEAGFQTTVSQYNIHNLEEIFDFVQRASLPIFTFAHESYYFYNKDIDEDIKQTVDKEKLMEGIEYIASNYTVWRPRDIVPKLYLKIAKRFYENSDEHPLPPSSGRGSISVDPYGKVKLFVYYGSDMGDLRENNYDIRSVLKSDKAQKELEKIDNDEGEIYWTNCEAYPTMFQNPFRALKKAFIG